MFDLLTANSDMLWKLVNAAWIPSLAIWLCVRARSPHVLLSRLWGAVQGKPRRTDPVIAKWVEGRDALVQFRVLSGARARTLANARRLIAWAERHNEDIADIARCDRNFDLERPGLRRTPGRVELSVAVVVLSLSVATLVLSTTCIFAPRAWVSVKEPGSHTLFLSKSDAQVWRSNRHFGIDECATRTTASLAAEMALSESEITVVCGWLKSPKLSQDLDKTLAGQRLAFGWLALLGAGYAWFSRQWVASTSAARDMAKRLAARTDVPRRRRRRKHTVSARDINPSVEVRIRTADQVTQPVR